MTAIVMAAVSRRCDTGEHDRCNGYPCACRCKHPTSLNARAAKAIALHAGGTPSDRRDLLDMLGIVDGPTGREVRPDPTGGVHLSGQGKAPGRDGDAQIRRGYAPDEPPPRNVTTPPGLRILPPPATGAVDKPAEQPTRTSKQKPIPHGSPAGYQAHSKRKEPIPADDPCGCRAAGTAYFRDRDQARRAAQRGRS